jgi:hypothetical protein
MAFDKNVEIFRKLTFMNSNLGEPFGTNKEHILDRAYFFQSAAVC